MVSASSVKARILRSTVVCLGIFIAISILAFSSFDLRVLLALGSFGSSAVLIFGFPDSPFSQPRSVIGGHFISTGVGLVALSVLGHSWWSLGLGVAAAAALMMLTRTVHPPAGSNPIIVFLALPEWDFLFFPTLFGAITLVAVAVLFHRVCRQAYPSYWISATVPSARTKSFQNRADGRTSGDRSYASKTSERN